MNFRFLMGNNTRGTIFLTKLCCSSQEFRLVLDLQTKTIEKQVTSKYEVSLATGICGVNPIKKLAMATYLPCFVFLLESSKNWQEMLHNVFGIALNLMLW
jgi:hypothetical protein